MNAWLIAGALWKRSLKQKYRLFFYILIPVIGVLLPFVVFSPQAVPTIKVGIVDHDDSWLSRKLGGDLHEIYGFEVRRVPEAYLSAVLIARGIDSVIEIPENYQKDFFLSQQPKLLMRAVQNGLEQQVVSAALEGYIGQLIEFWQLADQDSLLFEQYYAQFKQDHHNMQIIQMQKIHGIGQQTLGLTIVLMSMMTTTLLGGVIEDQKNKTYARILSTATGCMSYVGGQILWILRIGCLQIGAVVGISQLKWMQIAINWRMLLVLLGCMLVMCIAIGVGVIACCRTQEHIAIMNMFVILPSSMLAGCLLPGTLMDEQILKIGTRLPQHQLLDLAQKMQQGEGMRALSGDLGMFFLTCSIIIVVGIWVLRLRGVEKMG
ncbi:MAG: ABC transporter permease [Cellulosilyticaceae bacterium]